MVSDVLLKHAYADSSRFNVGRALARHFDGIHARLFSGINADLQGNITHIL